jgi:hypothetical protein
MDSLDYDADATRWRLGRTAHNCLPLAGAFPFFTRAFLTVGFESSKVEGRLQRFSHDL